MSQPILASPKSFTSFTEHSLAMLRDLQSFLFIHSILKDMCTYII